MGYGNARLGLTRQCSPQIEGILADTKPTDQILDMGAGGRRLSPQVKTVDFVDTGVTDYICDVCDVPLPDSSIDLIVATGLIEHLEDSDKFLTECHRLLKPGGKIHVEVPFLQQYHDDPIDVRRYTVNGLAIYMAKHQFDPVKNGFHIGPTVTIATLNAHYAALLFEGKSFVAKLFSNAAFFAMSLIWKTLYLS